MNPPKPYSKEVNKTLVTEYCRLRDSVGSEDPQTIKARNRLIEANQQLLWKRASKLADKRFQAQDLLSSATIGLIYALAKFDPSQGYELSTYCQHWIDQEIRREKENTRCSIRVPNYLHHKSASSLKPYIEAKRILRGTSWASFEDPVSVQEDSSSPLHEVIPDPQSMGADDLLAQKEQHEALRAAIAKLPYKYRYVFRGLYLDSKTLDNLADELGIRRQRIEQIEKEGLTRIQRILKVDLLQFRRGKAQHRKTNGTLRDVKGYTATTSGRYRAQIAINGRPQSLGVFDTPEEAADAYQKAKEEREETYRKRNENT